jgi:hypothetical protein
VGNNSNANKSEQLGMSAGKANGILRKQLLFKYVQIVGDDICFKCEELIESVDELSIEHKLPWQGRDTSRFWDLDNIAFSHIRCNVPHEYGGKQLRRVGPEGTAWCIGHQAFLPIEKFQSRAEHWNGLQHYCKECRIPVRRAQYQRNRASATTS